MTASGLQPNKDLEPYAGRWVALVEDEVAGVGYTPSEAERLARRNRPKERFTVVYVEAAGGVPLTLSPLVAQLEPIFAQHDVPVYLVGGAVRDALLGHVSHDLDFVVPLDGIRLAFKVADALEAPAYILDRERDTGRVVLPDQETMLDFARFRGGDLVADLRDRDFTINALALPVGAATSASIIDPCGGGEDLKAGVIRTTHASAISDDAVRALRAVRLAARFGFQLADETLADAQTAAPLLDRVSPERVRDELVKLLDTDAPHGGVSQLAELSLLAAVLPELAKLRGLAQSPPHHEPVLAHTISVLRWLVQVERALSAEAPGLEDSLAQIRASLAPYEEKLARHLARKVDGGLTGRMLLRMGALFHDVGKAETQSEDPDGRIRYFGHDKVGAKLAGARLRRLRFSNETVAHVKTVVAGHMRPLLLNQADQVSRRAVYRFFRDTGIAGLDIGLLSLADHLATNERSSSRDTWTGLLSVVTRLYQHFFEGYEETIAPPPLLRGTELMAALHLKPGPEVGRLLGLIEEAQAAGEITTKEEALAMAHAMRQE